MNAKENILIQYLLLFVNLNIYIFFLFLVKSLSEWIINILFINFKMILLSKHDEYRA